MRLSSKVAKQLRKYERSLFDGDHPYNDRLYAFYLVLLPTLEWMKAPFYELGLEKYEVEAEIYLLAHKLFDNFDRDKSSIVPYIERYLLFFLPDRLKELRKTNVEIPSGLLFEEESYVMDEEFYWNVPEILLNERYVGKRFTRSEKYLIYMILISDEKRLTKTKLSNDMNMSRETLSYKIKNIKEILINGGYYEYKNDNGSRFN